MPSSNAMTAARRKAGGPATITARTSRSAWLSVTRAPCRPRKRAGAAGAAGYARGRSAQKTGISVGIRPRILRDQRAATADHLVDLLRGNTQDVGDLAHAVRAVRQWGARQQGRQIRWPGQRGRGDRGIAGGDSSTQLRPSTPYRWGKRPEKRLLSTPGGNVNRNHHSMFNKMEPVRRGEAAGRPGSRETGPSGRFRLVVPVMVH